MAKQKKSNKVLYILVGLVVVLVVFAIIGKSAGWIGKTKEIEVEVTEAKSNRIVETVSASGMIQPVYEVKISPDVPGEIIELPVRDGDSIEKGDLLVRVNPDTLEAQVKQQEAALAATRAASAQQRAEMLQAELDLERVRGLFEKEFATADELEQAKTRLEIARAAHESSLFQIQRQEMQLKEASDQLAKASIFSPISGTITRLNTELGDRVVGTGQFEGTEILRVANLSSMEVQVDVSEADIVNIEIGDIANVEVDALPDEALEGAVSEIANSALTSNERSQEQVTTFSVKIRLKEGHPSLRPGMTATADIQTETVTDVVKVPLGSVVVRPRREVEKTEADGPAEEPEGEEEEENESEEAKKDNRVRVVFLARDGKAILRKVETGIADRDSIEIKEGLEKGDTVITGSYRALTRELEDGSQIRIKDRPKREDDQ